MCCGQTDGRTEGQRQNSIPPQHSLRGYKKNWHLDGRTAPRTAAMDTFRRGSGGTSLGEWEHNNKNKNWHNFCHPFILERLTK